VAANASLERLLDQFCERMIDDNPELKIDDRLKRVVGQIRIQFNKAIPVAASKAATVASNCFGDDSNDIKDETVTAAAVAFAAGKYDTQIDIMTFADTANEPTISCTFDSLVPSMSRVYNNRIKTLMSLSG
jgi:hypothetical protein